MSDNYEKNFVAIRDYCIMNAMFILDILFSELSRIEERRGNNIVTKIYLGLRVFNSNLLI